MRESDIHDFWESHPCDELQVGNLTAEFKGDYKKFFDACDAYRYKQEEHILACLNEIDFDGKEVLEIGLGEGSDSEQIIRRGARWSGLDLTAESVARVRARMRIRDLPYGSVMQGSALEIPFGDNSFDMVFSHGVLHHIPEIKRAQSEIARILRPGGQLICMLYAKWSLNYLISIALVRRLGLITMYALGREFEGIYGQHIANARKAGLWNYVNLSNFIHRNTDGPKNPYSKVYDLKQVAIDFPDFTISKSYRRFMHAPPLPVKKLPLARIVGWHLWVHMNARKTSDPSSTVNVGRQVKSYSAA